MYFHSCSGFRQTAAVTEAAIKSVVYSNVQQENLRAFHCTGYFLRIKLQNSDPDLLAALPENNFATVSTQQWFQKGCSPSTNASP